MTITRKTGIWLVSVLLLAGLAIFSLRQSDDTLQPNNPGETFYSGNYQIQLALNPEKPKIGNNQLTIALFDENHQPVTDVQIDAYAEMPAMGSMQAMREPVNMTNTGSGRYSGDFSLPMNGSWPITLHIQSVRLGQADAVFDLNTSRAGVKLIQATNSGHAPQPDQSAVSGQQLNSFQVDQYRRQLIGVSIATVVRQKLVKTIRAAASVSYDQTRLTDISLKYDAWIGRLNADYVGKYIQQGETLLTVYSPDLVSAQHEYLESLKQRHVIGLNKAARQRLKLWDIDNAQIKAIAKRGRAIEYLPIVSPVSGTMIEKNIVAGSAVKAGTRLLRLADLSRVWIEGEVYESDLPWLKPGLPVSIVLPEQPEQTYSARLTFIDPVLNPQTRSAVIRAELDNANGVLRPAMYATMLLQVDLGERLVVPEQAVIYAGAQRIVFVDQDNGRLLPVKIKTGLRNDDLIEVLDGLASGERIVTSANFLIAAESKLKAGLAQW